MRSSWSQVKGWRKWRKAWTRPWGYCQSRGCEFRTPVADLSSDLKSTTGTGPPTSVRQELTTMLTLSTISNRRRSNDSQPPLSSTPYPHLQLPEVLPPCGMSDPVQVELKFSSKKGQPYGRARPPAPHPSWLMLMWLPSEHWSFSHDLSVEVLSKVISGEKPRLDFNFVQKCGLKWARKDVTCHVLLLRSKHIISTPIKFF